MELNGIVRVYSWMVSAPMRLYLESRMPVRRAVISRATSPISTSLTYKCSVEFTIPFGYFTNLPSRDLKNFTLPLFIVRVKPPNRASFAAWISRSPTVMTCSNVLGFQAANLEIMSVISSVTGVFVTAVLSISMRRLICHPRAVEICGTFPFHLNSTTMCSVQW